MGLRRTATLAIAASLFGTIGDYALGYGVLRTAVRFNW